MSDYPRSVIIRDVTAKWAKISGEDAPTNAFGATQWEMSIQTTSPEKAQEMRDLGFKVKEAVEEGSTVYTVGLKRKGFKAGGEKNTPVKVVDKALQPVTANVGNGSKVNVNVFQYEYEFAGRAGVAHSLTGVQVVDLVEYKPQVGFEAIESVEATEDSPF